ncbi:MAG: 3-keto-5-aminohexanoate cleavage protein [Betaproteobacteria bacterium]|nr:3-keto-5-aminohexanoate cleavage protein [Betaproteobacteria bacterium]
MAALNGARLQKSECAAVPVSVKEIAAAAVQCFSAGADSVHAHVRDRNGGHILDAGLYRELLGEIKQRAAKLKTQITTESAGKYAPPAQRKVALESGASEVSAAWGEMFADGDKTAALNFYRQAAARDIKIQHILRAPAEIFALAGFIKSGALPKENLSLLFVLGKHGGKAAHPEELAPFLAALKKSGLAAQFMACAFGRRETECLLATAAAGGNCRIGMENNIYMDNGETAPNNAARVLELQKRLESA